MSLTLVDNTGKSGVLIFQYQYLNILFLGVLKAVCDMFSYCWVQEEVTTSLICLELLF